MNTCICFLRDYVKDRLYDTNPRTVRQLQAETEAVAQKVTGGMVRDTTLWLVYGESTRSTDLILNVCSHDDSMHTYCP
jgi:hypothetical protein